MNLLSPAEANFFLDHRAFIDVRAPGEFALGHLAGAVNLPLLNDEERHRVGLTYKVHGQEAAIRLGHELVSGSVKEERVQSWKSFLQSYPQAVVYCARGGLRSKISQQWLKEAGCEIFRLDGGYKSTRQLVLATIQKSYSLCSIGGLTGSGKSQLLSEVKSKVPVLDLELLAGHRGSAFGKLEAGQPPQALFENRLAQELALNALGERKIFCEDESRLVGHRCLPEPLFQQLRLAPMVYV
jgi:tRNA 2-selenouridine synthase